LSRWSARVGQLFPFGHNQRRTARHDPAVPAGFEILDTLQPVKGFDGDVPISPMGVLQKLQIAGLASVLHQIVRQRIPLSINKVSFSVLLKRKDTDYIEDIRMALGAVAPTVIRVKNAEEYIKGRKITPDVIKHVGKLCSQVSKPITDVRSNIDYRKAMCGVLAERLLKKLLESNS